MPDDQPVETEVVVWDAAEAGLPASVAAVLERGGLVAFPTDTVYGLAANARRLEALTRLFAVKGRPEHKPLPVLIASAEYLPQVAAAIPPAALGLAERFWPGPLTLVLPKRSDLPDLLTAGRPTVGVRVPDHEVARAILAACDFPVAVTSANRSGAPEAVTPAEVLTQLAGPLDLLVDAGPCPGGLPSTVVDLTTDPPVILREGPVSAAQLWRVLGR